MCKTAISCLARIAALVLALFCSSVNAEDYFRQDPKQGYLFIDAEDLLVLLEDDPTMVIIDTRSHTHYRQGHIAGAVNLLHRDSNCGSLRPLVPSMSTPVTFYCDDVDCRGSRQVAIIAAECGYTKVYWLRGGVAEWTGKMFPLAR